MENIIFFVIASLVGSLFLGLGIYARKRKKPMWFWSGSEVRPEEIRDVPAYNRANGWMWIAYSGVFWVSAALSLMNVDAAGAALAAGCLGGIPLLVFAYGRIYARYKAK